MNAEREEIEARDETSDAATGTRPQSRIESLLWIVVPLLGGIGLLWAMTTFRH